jgi:hypothetical protein
MHQHASIHIATPAATVFARYSDVASWPEWDPELVSISLPEGLKTGSTGWLKPKGGPKSTIRVIAVEPDRSFTIECPLPLCRMRFDHTLAAAEGGTLATHGLAFDGPLAWLFRRLIGKSIMASLPATLQGLKRACEQGAARAAA